MKEKNKDEIEDIEQKEEKNDDSFGNYINNEEIELIYYFKDRDFRIFGTIYFEK